MIKLLKENNFLILKYTPDRSDVEFVHEYLKDGQFKLKKSFYFVKNNVYQSLTTTESISFHIATLDNG
ncbi:hypothetical protein [Sulfurimonas sp.]|uniref:hypothetical protein n=1 Tax=Sulfurimonas sp. TaxID=2022749 RepID=UPI002AB1B73C|nr:hypothetical protein [Sulfurimonas sp.]